MPEEVNDDIGHIHLPAGTYKVNGNQALDYVRVRHGIGAETGDIGRMKRQQAFISAMIEKVVSKGTLANPVRLYKFLDAATQSLTTDTGVRPPQGAGLPRVVAEEHRAGQRPVHHRAQRALRARPQPAPARPRGQRRCGARSASTSRWASSARTRSRRAASRASKPSGSATPSTPAVRRPRTRRRTAAPTTRSARSRRRRQGCAPDCPGGLLARPGCCYRFVIGVCPS